MPFKNHGRQYDLVVFGTTGYTGGLAAEHIASSFPTNLKWAIAGRSESKLKSVVSELRLLSPDRVQPGVFLSVVIVLTTLHGHWVTGALGYHALAKKTFILITTVGPYFQYGEYAFKACAENGTHYFDVTGEVPWVKKMITKYEDAAKASGAMMFPEIGVESAPPDLLTWAMAKTLREQLSAQTGDVTVSVHALDSAPSGGTLATVLGIFNAFTMKEIQAAFEPYSLSPLPNTKEAPRNTLLQKLFGVRQDPELGTLTTFLGGTTDAAIVNRSWGLHASISSREKQAYGPNFSFREFYRVRNWLEGVMIHLGLAIGILFLSTPLRALVKSFIYQPGQGPDKEVAKKDYIEYRGIAVPDSESARKVAWGKAHYQGSMYLLSGMLPSQGALTVLEEDLDLPGGIFTASCLGQSFVDRVDEAGFKLETKLITPQ